MTTIPNTAEEVLAATEDLGTRKKWDELFIEGNVVEQLDADHQVLHFKFKVSPSFAFPLCSIHSASLAGDILTFLLSPLPSVLDRAEPVQHLYR